MTLAKSLTKIRRARTSEFRAYPWIERQLKIKGWNVGNPNTKPDGEVWTQSECLDDPQLAKALGAQRPENVVKISSSEFWIVEAKPGKARIDIAGKEAKEYADLVNTNSSASALLATGVAGDDDDSGFLVRHFIYLGGKWQTVTNKGKPLERFPTRNEVRRLISKKTPRIEPDEISQQELVDLSNYINRQLHVAKVTKENRAILVAILLIALHQDPSLKMSSPEVFLRDINARAEQIFRAALKQELWDEVKITFTKENAPAVASALDRIIVRLREADIVSSLGDADVLGPFFESFLRYGNTSKDLGIVLTPRQICWLAAEILDVRADDVVYDPAAGTGGFLIAALTVSDI